MKRLTGWFRIVGDLTVLLGIGFIVLHLVVILAGVQAVQQAHAEDRGTPQIPQAA